MQIIHSDRAPKAIGPISSQIVETGIEGQTRQVFLNIREILKAASLTFDDVVRMEVFLKDMADFQAMNGVYATFFPNSHKPARHAFQVAKLPMDALIEITCTAYCGSRRV